MSPLLFSPLLSPRFLNYSHPITSIGLQCVRACVHAFVCELIVTNTGGMQTKSIAIIGVSRGQAQLTQVIGNYIIIYV